MKYLSLLCMVAVSSAVTLNKRFPADVQDANPAYPAETHEMTPLTAHDNH